MTSGNFVGPRLGLLGDSFIYASGAVRSRVRRHSVTLACALTPQPLRVSVAGQHWSGRLVAVRPFSTRAIDSGGQPAVLIDLEPTHPRYNTFSRWSDRAPVRVLDEQHFAGLLDCASAFASYALSGRRLQASVQMLVGSVADSVSPHQPLDPRVLQMMAGLRLDPAQDLATLGAPVGMSAAQASRGFLKSLGISARQYALAVKIQRAAMFFGSGRALTAIAQASGFADSAHLAKVWVRCYGDCPSRYFSQHRGAQEGQVDHAWRQRVSLQGATGI
ncbi:AraC family transcriptional regulator [Mitsuaria sp. CC2]|jgi:AraC-like DNA-binding protein|uniref:helix-turn-helix domain-containing protein n=1 Tax=Mitsuaria sp. CC2 TaxID=3029186 RepID=UPI003B8BFD5E